MPGTLKYLLFIIVLSACKGHYYKEKENFSHLSLKQTTINQQGVELVAVYKQKLSGEMNRVIAVADGAFTRDNKQCTLGNFVCDAMWMSARKVFLHDSVDVTLVNHGGLRANLPQGDITVGHIFEVMPFENQLVMVKIKGEKLIAGIKTIVAKHHSYAGLKLELRNDSIVAGEVGGKQIDPTKTYNLVTSDYLANGGDSFNFLFEPVELKTSEIKIRDAMIDYCEQLSKQQLHIKPYTDDRLRETK